MNEQAKIVRLIWERFLQPMKIAVDAYCILVYPKQRSISKKKPETDIIFDFTYKNIFLNNHKHRHRFWPMRAKHQ